MMNASALEKAAQRRVTAFERKYGAPLLHLAYHAALPAALNADLVHFLRINFFFDGAEQLPYIAEADLLLSPLCAEIGDELYEMDHEVRDILLQELTNKYGSERLHEVAALLWEYDQHSAPWSERDMLERAQQLSALSFLDPARARQWYAQQSTDQRPIEQRAWFAAVNKEVLLAEKVLSSRVEQAEQPYADMLVANAGEDQPQTTPVEQIDQVNTELLPANAGENNPQTMTEEPERAYVKSSPSSSHQEIFADELVTKHPAIAPEASEKHHRFARVDRIRLREEMARAFSLEELRSLCSDITQALRHDGINDPVYLDMLEGTSLDGKVVSLIGYCERRGQLETLARVVLDARPRLASILLETEQEPSFQVQPSKEPTSVDKGRRMDHEQHNRLVTLLLEVPGIEDFKARSNLLVGISNPLSLHRSNSSVRLDISLLIDQLAEMRLQNGQRALLIFIDNVIQRVDGTIIGEQLKELRRQLEASSEQMEQEPSSQVQLPKARSSQKKSSTSKETDTSNKKKAMSGGTRMISQPDRDSDSKMRLEKCRQIIAAMEHSLDVVSPRVYTIEALINYENELLRVIEMLREMRSPRIERYIRSSSAVLDDLRSARDELTLAVEQLSEKGRNRQFLTSLRKCRSYLEQALKQWK